MSVTETLSLPAQPSSGTVTYEPLGGDGMIAPLAAYWIDNFIISGDASGGVAELVVECDPRYECLVGFLSSAAWNGTISAGVGCTLTLKWGTKFDASITKLGTYEAPDNKSRLHWAPDPIFGPESWTARFENNNGASFLLQAIVYLFKKNVQQYVPLTQLLASLPRGTSSL